MKSAIYLEISEATGLTVKRGQDTQEFLQDLVKGVANLKDPEWDKLSAAAQDWYNAAASAKNKKKAIEMFPDLEQADEEEDKPRRSRRQAEDAEDADVKPMLKVGDVVTVKTKKGTERTGEIVEQDDKVLVIKDGDDEFEYKRENLESITAKHGNSDDEDKPRSRRKAAEEDDEPAVPELKKGSKVVAVTKRGKTIEGVVEKISDAEVSIDDGNEIWDFDIDRLESLTPAGGGKAAKTEEAEDKPRGRSSAKKDEEPAAERKRASNGDVSVGQRIRELIAEDFDISQEDLIKQLKKEKLEFKDNTVSLNYKECLKFIDILRKAKKLK